MQIAAEHLLTTGHIPSPEEEIVLAIIMHRYEMLLDFRWISNRPAHVRVIDHCLLSCLIDSFFPNLALNVHELANKTERSVGNVS